MTEHTVRVHFIDDSERIVPAKDIHYVGEEGARSATAIVDGKEVPIYNRVEWGFLWEEQATIETVHIPIAFGVDEDGVPEDEGDDPEGADFHGGNLFDTDEEEQG